MSTSKVEYLNYIRDLAAHQLVTREELLRAYDEGTPHSSLSSRLSMSELLFYLGAFIIVLGVTIPLAQNWSLITTLTKLLLTLGTGIVSYGLGVMFNHEEKYAKLGTAFHLVAALVFPLGLTILAQETLGVDSSSSGIQVIISAVLLVSYLTSYQIFRKDIFTLFSILFGTWLYFALIQVLFGNLVQADFTLPLYAILVAGSSYLLLGYYFEQIKKTAFVGFLYAFGIMAFLGSALALGGFAPAQNIFWELAYPLIIFGVFYASVWLHSKSFLVFGALFLMGYILKTTSEYFADSFGWPATLVLCGLALIGIGYYTVNLSKRYLAK